MFESPVYMVVPQIVSVQEDNIVEASVHLNENCSVPKSENVNKSPPLAVLYSNAVP